MMRHIAENKNDPSLLSTMDQVNNRGQLGRVGEGGDCEVDGRGERRGGQREQLPRAAQHVPRRAGADAALGHRYPGGERERAR